MSRQFPLAVILAAVTLSGGPSSPARNLQNSHPWCDRQPGSDAAL